MTAKRKPEAEPAIEQPVCALEACSTEEIMEELKRRGAQLIRAQPRHNVSVVTGRENLLTSGVRAVVVIRGDGT